MTPAHERLRRGLRELLLKFKSASKSPEASLTAANAWGSYLRDSDSKILELGIWIVIRLGLKVSKKVGSNLNSFLLIETTPQMVTEFLASSQKPAEQVGVNHDLRPSYQKRGSWKI